MPVWPGSTTRSLPLNSSGRDLDAIKHAAATNGIRLSFTREKRSLADLDRVRTAVQNDVTVGAGRIGAVVEPATNRVEVSSDVVTPQVVAAARDRFGDAVHLTQRAQGQRSFGRFDDSSPYYGGDRIGNPQASCTHGFGLTNLNGVRYGITAGHCFPVGAGVSALRWFPGSNNAGTGYADFGQVKFRRYQNDNDLDNELIGSWNHGEDFGGFVWVDPNLQSDHAQAAPVHDAHDSCVGCQVCFDGSYTGMHLMNVTRYVGCADLFGDHIISCGLWAATAADGSGTQACVAGSSGGPVLAFDGHGGITAVGIITGINGNTCYYTSVPQILRSWQSTITTG